MNRRRAGFRMFRAGILAGLAALLPAAIGQPHHVCYNTLAARFEDEWHRPLYAEMSWRELRLFWEFHGGPDKLISSSRAKCYDLNDDRRLDLRDVAAFNNRRT